MPDENHGSEGQSGASPESLCLKNNNNNYNKEQDRFLPIANVGRIMKKEIPGNGKISKDAKETVQECVSEFISFVTGEASDKCQREKRKTINGDDIIWAITTLGFEDYVNPLKVYLSKYRDTEGEKLNVPKQQRPHQHQHQQQQQQQQHEQEHEQIIVPYNNNCTTNGTSSIYSTTNFMTSNGPHPSFVGADQHQHHHHHQQTFSLPPFSQTSIQNQFQQHEQIDSIGHW